MFPLAQRSADPWVIDVVYVYLESWNLTSKMNQTITLLLLSLVTAQSLSQVSAASIQVEIADQSVMVRVESHLFQNMTRLPELNIDISGNDLSNAQLALESALRAKSALSISSLSMRIVSQGVWFNVTAQFAVEGTSKFERDTISTYLGWLPFKVTTDLKAGNLSYNLFGAKHLLPVITRMANRTDIKYFSPAFTPVNVQMAKEIAGNVTTFDLTLAVSNLSSWPRKFDIGSRSTVWHNDVGQTLDLRIEIPQVAQNLSLYAATSTQARVSVQGHGNASADMIVVETATGRQEVTMLGTVAGLVLLSVITRHYERRVLRVLRK